MMTELEKYYNKFNEEKRLKSRHGQVEFITSMKYIHKYLPKREHGQVKILDVGAGVIFRIYTDVVKKKGTM